MMKEQELNKLLDKAIGTKGNLKVPSFWMRKIFKELIEWCKSLNNSLNNSLDYVTKEELNNKQDWIPDLNTIRNNANNALKSIPLEYVTETELELKKCRINWHMIINHHIKYLTFNVLEDGNFSFSKKGTGDDIQYSKDNGSTWTSLTSDEPVSVVTGDKVMWKSTLRPLETTGIGKFSSTGKFNISGNIMSMLYGDDFVDKTDLTGLNWCFHPLFMGTNVVDASKLILPATALAQGCYGNMFNKCKSLTTAPELPATTLATSCYNYMFLGCSSLTTAPELPATVLRSNCYFLMFDACTSLVNAPELPATELALECYQSMFKSCTSLVNAPELPATTLAPYCYEDMFLDCIKLNNITMLATDISAPNCLKGWVSGVASTGTFVKHPNMTSVPSGTSGIPSGWTVVDYVES